MELYEIGSLLRREREKHGLSMDDVMQRTKISRKNLMALESGNPESMPHPVYAKGFVKNYAQLLGLDENEIGEAFSKAFEPFLNRYEENWEEITSDTELPPGKKIPAFFILLGCLLIIVITILYFSLFSGDTPQEEELVSVPQMEKVEPLQDLAEPAPAEEGLMEEEIGSEGLGETGVQETGEAPLTETPVAEVETTGVTKDTVVIRAFEECWLEAKVDDESMEAFLRPGQELELSFSDSLMLRLGNGGGVDVTYNGTPYPFKAKTGKVAYLEFPPSAQ